MMRFFSKTKHFYQNLHLQTKFTISHLVIVTIPMIVLGVFFYTKLNDMILSDTIRTEQTASAEIVPIIDQTVQSILDKQQEILALDSTQTLINYTSDQLLDLDRLQLTRQFF